VATAIEAMTRTVLIVASLLLLPMGCGRSDPPAREAKRLDGYVTLPADNRAARELLVTHLTSSVHRVGDLLIVQDKGAPGSTVQTYVLPASAGWRVGCGAQGVDVRFGASADEVSVNLSLAPVPDPDRCTALSLTVAQTLQGIVGRTY
jgi:hypothetical protein